MLQERPLQYTNHLPEFARKPRLVTKDVCPKVAKSLTGSVYFPGGQVLRLFIWPERRDCLSSMGEVVKMKRAAIYTRVSTCDQNPETQAIDLRRLAEQRGFEIVHEYSDRISGAKAKRPALDQMLAAAHRREFDTVLVWAAAPLARSVRHFLEVLDTLNHFGIEFVSFREHLDTGGRLAGPSS